MKSTKKLQFYFTLFLIITIIYSCKNDEIANKYSTVNMEVVKIYDRKVILNGTNTQIKPSSGKINYICWSTNHNPTIDDYSDILSDTSSITYEIYGLTPNTTYYLRSMVSAEGGTVNNYSNELSFTTTSNDGTVGTVVYHKTVIIGSQTWMAENLATTVYRNGDIIEGVNYRFNNRSYGSYQDWTSDYGCYYNDKAIFDERNIAPLGWHIATYENWKELFKYIGYMGKGSNIVYKLKEIGSAHWDSNSNATDEFGFCLRPGGCYVYGGFRFQGSEAIYDAIGYGYYLTIGTNWGLEQGGGEFRNVRCVKD